MSEFYVGTTETYDPVFVPHWESNLLDANIIITKNLSDSMIEKLLLNKDKVILHHTVTGQGGTALEPNVPNIRSSYHQFEKLIKSGFPLSNYVLRIDPIILFNEDQINNVLAVLDYWGKYVEINQTGKIRSRVSLIDLYPHVITRLEEADIKLPWRSFHPPKKAFDLVNILLRDYLDCFEFECCAESGFDTSVISPVGCVSYKDLNILGKDCDLYAKPTVPQRKLCSCLNKKQILKVKPGRCPHGCLYCYWKD